MATDPRIQLNIHTLIGAGQRGPGGVPVMVSSALPTIPSFGEDIRRRVRHGLADVLTWLGEDVGPAPGEPSHAYAMGGRLVVSQELADRMRHEAKGWSVA